jgi:hypothetical protein
MRASTVRGDSSPPLVTQRFEFALTAIDGLWCGLNIALDDLPNPATECPPHPL